MSEALENLSPRNRENPGVQLLNKVSGCLFFISFPKWLHVSKNILSWRSYITSKFLASFWENSNIASILFFPEHISSTKYRCIESTSQVPPVKSIFHFPEKSFNGLPHALKTFSEKLKTNGTNGLIVSNLRSEVTASTQVCLGFVNSLRSW